MKTPNPIPFPDDSGFWVLAGSYRDAAQATHESIQSKEYTISAMALVFLCYRSIELALKSVLRKKSYSEDEMRCCGHNLSKLMEHVEKNSISLINIGISLDVKNMLLEYSEEYSKKWFEYSDEFHRHPKIEPLLKAYHAVCEKTRTYKF